MSRIGKKPITIPKGVTVKVVDHAVEVLLVELQRIVAAVEELDFGAEQGGGAFGLVLATSFDLFHRRAWFFPRELALAALTEGHADDLHLVAALGVQRDGAARAPDKIARMSGDDETCLLLLHKPYVP